MAVLILPSYHPCVNRINAMSLAEFNVSVLNVAEMLIILSITNII